MRLLWQMLWPGELPLRDVDADTLVWRPREGWTTTTKSHAVILLSSIHVPEARQWIRSRAKKLENREGVLLVYMRDPRIMKGGNFIRKKVGDHYTITHAPFEVVAYDDYVQMGLMFWREPPRDVYDYDEKPPHPELNFTEIAL